MAPLTPAEFTRRATRVLDEVHAPERQRARATRASLLLFAGRLDEAVGALAELATLAESHPERQAWLELGDELVGSLDRRGPAAPGSS